MKTIKIILIALLVSLCINLLFIYFNWQDNVIEVSAENYKACVLKKYHTNPEKCREDNGGQYCICE